MIKFREAKRDAEMAMQKILKAFQEDYIGIVANIDDTVNITVSNNIMEYITGGRKDYPYLVSIEFTIV